MFVYALEMEYGIVGALAQAKGEYCEHHMFSSSNGAKRNHKQFAPWNMWIEKPLQASPWILHILNIIFWMVTIYMLLLFRDVNKNASRIKVYVFSSDDLADKKRWRE